MQKIPDLDTMYLSLYSFLRDNGYPEQHDSNFISLRADEALEVLSDARLRGLDVPTAIELANTSLFQGFDFSFDGFIKEILEQEFNDDLPDWAFPLVMPYLREILAEYSVEYDLTREFFDTPTGKAVRLEIIGRIDEYFDQTLRMYGL